MKKRAKRAYLEGERAHPVSQVAMRRVSGVGCRGYWVGDCGWLVSWWEEEGSGEEGGREMFDRTKYLASTVPRNGVVGASLLKTCLYTNVNKVNV